MFHLTDLIAPHKWVCKRLENPLEHMSSCRSLPQHLQGQQADIFMGTMLGVGDVCLKVLKPQCVADLVQDIVELEIALHRAGAPVAEVLSFHEWVTMDAKNQGTLYRYYAGGDLCTQIQRLHLSKAISQHQTESIAYSIAKMLCEALALLHLNGWIHADIKPENIFLSHDIESCDCRAFLGDFGKAVRVGMRINKYMTGTKTYFPLKDFSDCFDRPAYTGFDMFSVAMTLQKFESIHRLSPHAQSVIRLLASDEAQRPTAAEMLSTHLPQWLSQIEANS
jgi:serine/threonine protein kinase